MNDAEERVTADLVVAAFIRKARGEILFVPRKGRWTLPTGHLHPSDEGDMQAALRREMKEELGVEIFINDSLGKFFRKENRNGRSKYIETFYCTISGAESKNVHYDEKGEVGHIWLTVEEAGQRDDLDDLAKASLDSFCQKLSQITRRGYGAKGRRGRGSSGSGSGRKLCHQVWVASV